MNDRSMFVHAALFLVGPLTLSRYYQREEEGVSEVRGLGVMLRHQQDCC